RGQRRAGRIRPAFPQAIGYGERTADLIERKLSASNSYVGLAARRVPVRNLSSDLSGGGRPCNAVGGGRVGDTCRRATGLEPCAEPSTDRTWQRLDDLARLLQAGPDPIERGDAHPCASW